MRVEWGSLVWLEYDAFLDSGAQFDSSADRGPLRIRVGEWMVLPGLERRLVGLREGDERLIRLAPGEAFGGWDPDAVLTMRESRLARDGSLAEGMTLCIETETGLRAYFRVLRLEEDRVALDFNHPLAGEPVTLFIRILRVVPPCALAARAAA